METTVLQKSRYIVPCIAPSKYYITEYEKFDVAVGFSRIEDIKRHLGADDLRI